MVPRLLSEDDSFGLDQEPRRELAWRLRHLPDNRPILWLVFRSTSDEQSELIAIPGRVAGANTGLVSLIPALATIVMRLRDHGLAVVSKDYAEKALAVAPVILLVAPSTRFDRSLVTCVELVADQYGFVLHWSPRAAGIHPARLQHDVAASRMVIADLTTESGRAAVEAAGSHGRRLVVIAPEGAELGAAWQRRILFYDENRAEFLQALADEIAAGTSLHRALTGDGGDENHPQRAILDPEQTIPNPLVREPWGGNQAPVPVPGIQPGAPDTPTEVGSAVV
ncbi:MAG TPA: hypothetical protein DEP84_31475, partial [Chloroflexi bacterium]|nr:hypothetical protein [Chloroflexota bacterium]